jgi:hypothetical protein
MWRDWGANAPRLNGVLVAGELQGPTLGGGTMRRALSVQVSARVQPGTGRFRWRSPPRGPPRPCDLTQLPLRLPYRPLPFPLDSMTADVEHLAEMASGDLRQRRFLYMIIALFIHSPICTMARGRLAKPIGF